MDLEKIAKSFNKFIKDEAIIAVGTFEDDNLFLNYLIKLLDEDKKKAHFIPMTSKQASILHSLGQPIISLSDREIDVAIEFCVQADSFNNFIKNDTKSFIRDKMVAQSALNLVLVVNDYDLVEEIDKDIYVEISTFSWERTIINLQSYGFSRVVKDTDDLFVKTEMGHYLARITLDKNISLEDFEYSVRNIPGVLETGVFLGLSDIFFVINNKDEIDVKIRKN